MEGPDEWVKPVNRGWALNVVKDNPVADLLSIENIDSPRINSTHNGLDQSFPRG